MKRQEGAIEVVHPAPRRADSRSGRAFEPDWPIERRQHRERSIVATTAAQTNRRTVRSLNVRLNRPLASADANSIARSFARGESACRIHAACSGNPNAGLMRFGRPARCEGEKPPGISGLSVRPATNCGRAAEPSRDSMLQTMRTDQGSCVAVSAMPLPTRRSR